MNGSLNGTLASTTMTSTSNNYAETTTTLRKNANASAAMDAAGSRIWHPNFPAAAAVVSCTVGGSSHSVCDNCDRASQLPCGGVKRRADLQSTELRSNRKRWRQAQGKVDEAEVGLKVPRAEQPRIDGPASVSGAAESDGEGIHLAVTDCNQRSVVKDVAAKAKSNDLNGYQSVAETTYSNYDSAQERRRRRLQRRSDRSSRRKDRSKAAFGKNSFAVGTALADKNVVVGHSYGVDCDPAAQSNVAADELADAEALDATILRQYSELPKQTAENVHSDTEAGRDRTQINVAADVCNTLIKFNTYRECRNEFCLRQANMRTHFHCNELACLGGRALIGKTAVVRHMQWHRRKQQQQQQQQQENVAVITAHKAEFVENHCVQPLWPIEYPSSGDEAAEAGDAAAAIMRWQRVVAAEAMADGWLAEEQRRARSTSASTSTSTPPMLSGALPLLAAAAAAADSGALRTTENNFYMRYRMLAASKVVAAALLAQATTEATSPRTTANRANEADHEVLAEALQQRWPSLSYRKQDDVEVRIERQQQLDQPQPTKDVSMVTNATTAATSATTTAAVAAVVNSNTLQITSIDGFFNRKRGRPPKNRFVEVYKNTQQSPQAIFTSFKLEKQGGQVYADSPAAGGSPVLMGAVKECGDRLPHPPTAGPTPSPSATATFKASTDVIAGGAVAIEATKTTQHQPLPTATGGEHFRLLQQFDKQPLRDARKMSSLSLETHSSDAFVGGCNSAAGANHEHSAGVFNAQKADKISVVRAAGTFYPENDAEQSAHAAKTLQLVGVGSSKQPCAKRSAKLVAVTYGGQLEAQRVRAQVDDANVPQDLRVNSKQHKQAEAAANAQQPTALCSHSREASKSDRRESAAAAAASIGLHFKQLLQLYQQQQQPQQQPYYLGLDSAMASAPASTAAAYLSLHSSPVALPELENQQQHDHFSLATTPPAAAALAPPSRALPLSPPARSLNGSGAATPFDMHAVAFFKSLTPAVAAAAAAATQQNLFNIMMLSAAASRRPLNGLLTQQSPPSQAALPTTGAPASLRLKQDAVRQTPAGYLKFRFNEDCGFAKCGYRNRQSHFHCNRRDCHYSFCDKTRFVQHTARHERLDTLMGDDFQQYRANMSCGYAHCAYDRGVGGGETVPKKSSHFHCLKCDFICADTNKVVAHRRLHSKMEYIRLAGFRKVPSTENCGQRPQQQQPADACAYSMKHTHYHCLVCDCSVLSRTQLASHRHKTGAAKATATAAATATSAAMRPAEAEAAETDSQHV